ncbi:MAG: hypothetical protein ABW346_00735 [Terrimicrobium sp.]
MKVRTFLDASDTLLLDLPFRCRRKGWKIADGEHLVMACLTMN